MTKSTESMFKRLFQISDAEIFPKSMIEEQCDYLSEMTDDKVRAHIRRTDEFKLDRIIHRRNTVHENEEQIYLGDDELPEIDYEFCLSISTSSNYKYRVFIATCVCNRFPVTLSLVQAISDELNWDNPTRIIKTRQEFKECFSEIINSEMMHKLVEQLYHAA